MPYPYPLNVETLLVIEEVTYGVDPTPTPAANAVRHIKHLWTDFQGEFAFPNLRDDVVTNTLIEAAPGIPRGRMVNFDLEVEVKGAGVAYSSVTPVRPEIDPLLRACGLSRTHVDTGGSETVTYALQDSGHASATLYIYAGGKRAIVVGARANLVWHPRAGELGRMRFNIMGLLTSVIESDPAPAGTYDATESPAAVSMGLSIDPAGAPPAWVPNWTEGELDLGNEVVRLDDANAADAIEGFFIPARAPRFRLTARTEDLADYDPEARRIANDSHTIDLSLGATQYNSMDIDVNDALLAAAPGRVEDNQFAGWTLEYMLRDLAVVFD